MTKKRRTILVVGGAGFIGSNLIEALRIAHPDDHIISLDNYFTGSKDNHIGGASYIEGSSADIHTRIKETPDIVYHLGEYARVEKSFDDMELVWKLNKQGTCAVLEFCRKTGAKLVYAGSSTKYGDGGLGRDQSPYAWAKATNTELVRNYGSWFGLPYAITYFYNVYGPREISSGPYATVIGIFKERMRRGESLPVVLPGTQTRNFTHVEDIVRGFMLVGEYGEGDEYGLGAEKEYSILEIAELFGGEIEMLPERKGNRMYSDLTVQKSKALGWKAEMALEEYIKSLKKTFPTRSR